MTRPRYAQYGGDGALNGAEFVGDAVAHFQEARRLTIRVAMLETALDTVLDAVAQIGQNSTDEWANNPRIPGAALDVLRTAYIEQSNRHKRGTPK